MKEFFSIVTQNGLNGLASAKINGTNINLLQFVAGDGNGSYYTPSTDQTSLVNELYRGELNRVYLDAAHPNQIIAEAVIPEEFGGFFIRECGIIDENGGLFSVGKYPVTYKPISDSGSGKELYIKMVIDFQSNPNVNLYLNPHTVLVSMDQLDDLARKDFSNVESRYKNHQNWSNLQGGTTSERFHVTKNQNLIVENIERLKVAENSGKCITINQDGEELITKDFPSGLPIFAIVQSLSAETPPGMYPLWTGEYIRNCQNIFPVFWNKVVDLSSEGLLRVISNEEYEEEIQLFGETGGFILNTDSGDLRLPKVTRFVAGIEQISQIGKAENDQIVNISGKFPDSGNVNNAIATPPFQITSEACYSNNGGAWDGKYISFDLSRSVRTGNEVQPKHIKVAQFIQVYSSAIPPSLAVCNEFVKTLADKADINLTNISTDGLGNLGFNNKLLAYDGYYTLPFGMILQWGHKIIGDIGNGTWWTTYPKSFPNECFSVSLTIINNSGKYVASHINSQNKDGFNACIAEHVAGNDAITVSFFAIGY